MRVQAIQHKILGFDIFHNYDMVKFFLAKNNILISPNYIIPKAMYYCVFRCVICQDIARGRKGRKAIERQVEIKHM
jgi:hypothetical protein